MADELSIRLFGGLRVALGGAPLNVFMSQKVPALLAYLAVSGRAQRRDELAALLWGEMSDVDARNNLRQAIANLRKFLEPYLIVTRESVELDAAHPVFLDTAAFEARLAPVSRLSGEARLTELGAAAALYQGDFLAGFYVRDAPTFEEWMLSQRARYREQALHALHTLTQHHLDAGQYDLAIQNATRLLSLDEWREEAHCQLMLALARTGQRSAALAQYQRCRTLLRKELDVEPSAATTQLYERIKAAMAAPRHNLPGATTDFVGREEEIAALRRLLAAPGNRLITILGPGGAGKTRLALQVAAVAEPMFLNGAWFVPLAAAEPRDVDALAQAIADALGCPPAGSGNPKALLLQSVRQRELLLVLDNLEEWGEAVAWIAELLVQAPGMAVLATSRERLNLQAERVFALGGLSAPPDANADLDLYASARLFMRRAERVQPNFRLSAADGPALARICRAVQGLPLGIELAAGWAHQLTCVEIAGELERSLDFLATDRRDVSARHRSLRAAFDWTWHRLGPREQVVFQRLAVFRGPFSRNAAGQVAAAPPDVLAGLADKSLLTRRGAAYQLHEVARRYAEERLFQAGEADAIQQAHAAHYSAFLDERQAALMGRDQQAAVAEIEDEIDNVRSAWQWMVGRRDVALIAAATGGLYHDYLLRSRFREGLEAFRAARQALEGDASGDANTRLTLGRIMAREARFCSSVAQYDDAQRLLAASLQLLETLGAASEIAFVLGHMGGTARLCGDLDLAESRLTRCLALRRELGDRWGQAIALLDLAGVAFMREDYETARRCCEEGLAVGEVESDLQTTAHLLTGLSLCQRELGLHQEAQASVRRSLPIYEELGDRYGMLQACLTIGELNRQLGHAVDARQFCQRALHLGQEIGDRSGEADAHYRLGQIAVGLGEYAEALHELRTALVQAHEIGETLTTLDILLELACALMETGETARPREILCFLLHEPQLPDGRRARVQGALARLPPGSLDRPAASLEKIVARATAAQAVG